MVKISDTAYVTGWWAISNIRSVSFTMINGKTLDGQTSLKLRFTPRKVIYTDITTSHYA